MATPFRPIEIPPGVVANATKKMRSSNWSEVNLVRWVEGQLAPVGGQSQYVYTFASRCRAVHSWFGLNELHHIAYLCEHNIYVDTEGTLTEITPVDGLGAPTVAGEGGYSDGDYSEGLYGDPRPPEDAVIAIDVMPNAYTLDNFGQILLAMASPDGRLLQWDPSGGGGLPWMTQVTSADTGTGFAPSGRTLRCHPGTLRPDFWHDQRRHARRRQFSEFRLVRPGEFSLLEFLRRDEPGWLS